MSRLIWLLLGAVMGGALVYGALGYHVVRASDGLHTVPKLSATLADTYVDIRGFGPEDWLAHRDLSLAILRAGKAELFREAPVEQIQQQLGHVLQSAQ